MKCRRHFLISENEKKPWLLATEWMVTGVLFIYFHLQGTFRNGDAQYIQGDCTLSVKEMLRRFGTEVGYAPGVPRALDSVFILTVFRYTNYTNDYIDSIYF